MVQVPTFPSAPSHPVVVLPGGKRSRAHKAVQPALKHFRTASPGPVATVPNNVHVHHFDELRALLLKKAGVDCTGLDAATKENALKEQYSPRLVDLLDVISSSINNVNDPFDDDRSSTATLPLSDVTHPSDDEPEADALVPTFKPSKSVRDATVPALPEKKSIKEVVAVKSSLAAPTTDAAVPQQTSYKSDTEIAISRIFDLGKVAAVEDPSIPADAPYAGPSVVAMTGFGELGRYGNQVLQYIFLKAYATRHNIAEIQVPGWVGAGLFGLNDRPVQRALPASVEYRGTVANSTFTTDFIDYVKAKSSDNVPELFPDVLASAGGKGPEGAPLKNVDMWGWFQWHTAHFAPFKNVLQETFMPVPELYNALHDTFDREIRHKGGRKRTVVGLHLRLGDYKNIAASSFGYCAPTAWYLKWLERIWPTLDNPVLFVASDDVDAVLRDFAAYDPITADSIGMTVPQSMKHLKAGFFPDWFSLTQCDVLAISNSTFSFTACMMNKRPDARFFRAHYTGNMEEIDPWNADPIVHRDMTKAGIQAALETLQIVYNTQGSRGLAKNILYELPYYGLRSAIMKAVLWRQSKQQPQAIVA